MRFLRQGSGPFSTVDALCQRLLRRWVPKWYGAFAKEGEALFFERLGRGFAPVFTGRRRLLSQLRQLAMYADASRRPGGFRPDLRGRFEAVLTRCAVPDEPGAWVFALDESGAAVLDPTRDLYTHAFVIFAFSHVGRATGDARARKAALATAGYIDRAFRAGVARGFTEALDVKGRPVPGLPRRHESHMHLLEGCLFAYDTWGDALFLEMADEIVGLFHTAFYDASAAVLSEYFEGDWVPAADSAKGCVVCEPGHYYEWIWLLKRHAAARGVPQGHDATCAALLRWANAHGWDEVYGGIYDELDAQGRVVADTKRLWPFTEGLKANALMLDSVADRDAAKACMARMTAVFSGRYMDERGFWTEWLNRDLTPAVDYMPATTPYHVYFGLMESLQVLRARGASKSLRAGPFRALYALRRRASALMRELRAGLMRVLGG